MTTITISSQISPNCKAFNFYIEVSVSEAGGDRALRKPIRFKRTTNRVYGVYCILGDLARMNALPRDWQEVKIGAHNDADINPLLRANFNPRLLPELNPRFPD